MEPATPLEEDTEISNFIKLKIKLYHITCPQHPCYIRRRNFDELHKIELSDLYKNSEILHELATYNFYGYATIIIWMNYQCLCRGREAKGQDILTQIIQAFEENQKNLRYITKILHLNYGMKLSLLKYQDKKRFKCFQYYFENIQKQKNYKKVGLVKAMIEELPFLTADNKPHFEDEGLSKEEMDLLAMAVRDYENYTTNINIDNLIFLQYLTYEGYMDTYLTSISLPLFNKLLKLFDELKTKSFTAVNEILYTQMLLVRRTLSTFNEDLLVAHTFTNMELYFYSINSALAIIINNRFLNSQEHDVRKGSDFDTEKLCNLYKVTKTLHCQFNDFTKNDFQQYFEWLSKADFKPFKNIYLIIMSHGDEEGVIYTEDDNKIYVQDIIDSFKASQTAEDAFKYIFLVACRGEFDERFADDDDEIPEDKSIDLKYEENMAIFFSTKEGHVSLRSDKKGTPFIETVSENLSLAEHNQNLLEVLAKKLNKEKSEYLVQDLNKSYPINKLTIPVTKDVNENFINNAKNLTKSLSAELELKDDLELSAKTKNQSKGEEKKGDKENEIRFNTSCVLFLYIFGPLKNLKAFQIFEENLKNIENYKEDLEDFIIKVTRYKCYTYKLFIEENLLMLLSDDLLKFCQWQEYSKKKPLFSLKDSELIQTLWHLCQTEFQLQDKKIFDNVCKNWLLKTDLRIYKNNLQKVIDMELNDLKSEIKEFIDILNYSPLAKEILKQNFCLKFKNWKDFNNLLSGLIQIIKIYYKIEKKPHNKLFFPLQLNTFKHTFCNKTYQNFILINPNTFFYDIDRLIPLELGNIKTKILNTENGIYIKKDPNVGDLNLEEFQEIKDIPINWQQNKKIDICRFLNFYAPLDRLENFRYFEDLLKTNVPERLMELRLYIQTKIYHNLKYNNNFESAIEDCLTLLLTNSLVIQIKEQYSDNLEKLEIFKILQQYIKQYYIINDLDQIKIIFTNWLSNSKTRNLKSLVLKKLLYISTDNCQELQELKEIFQQSSEINYILKSHYSFHIPNAFQKDYNSLIALWYIIYKHFSKSPEIMPGVIKDILLENKCQKDPYFQGIFKLYKFKFYHIKQLIMFNNHTSAEDLQDIIEHYLKLGLSATQDQELFVDLMWRKLLQKNNIFRKDWETVMDLNIYKIMENFFYSITTLNKKTRIFENLSEQVFKNYLYRDKYYTIIRELPLKSLDSIFEYEEILKLSATAQNQLKSYIHIYWQDQETLENNIYSSLHRIIDIKQISDLNLYREQNDLLIETCQNLFFLQILQDYVNSLTKPLSKSKFNEIIKNFINKEISEYKICENSIQRFVDSLPLSSLYTLKYFDRHFKEHTNDFRKLQQYFEIFLLNSYNSPHQYDINNIWFEIIDEKELLFYSKPLKWEKLCITQALRNAFNIKFADNGEKFFKLSTYFFDQERIEVAQLIQQMPFNSKSQILQLDSLIKKSTVAYQYFYSFFNYFPAYYKTSSLLFSSIFNILKFWQEIIADNLKSDCIWNTNKNDKSLLLNPDIIIVNDLKFVEIFFKIYDSLLFKNISQIWFNNETFDIIDNICKIYEVKCPQLERVLCKSNELKEEIFK